MKKTLAQADRVLGSRGMVEDEHGEITHVIFHVTGRMKNPGLLTCKRAHFPHDEWAQAEDGETQEMIDQDFLGVTFTLDGMQFYDKGEFISCRRFIVDLADA